MAVYKVVEVGDEILRGKAQKVTKFGRTIEKLLDNMRETMYAYDGVGLAAPQIGVSKQVIVIDVGEGLVELINPAITAMDGSAVGSEGCLSVPGMSGEVTRASMVTVIGLDRTGQEVEIKADGFLARALQHEIDHLHGVLFLDKARNLKRID